MEIVSPKMYNENYKELAQLELETTVSLINENLMKGKTIIELKNSLNFDVINDLRRIYKKEGWSDVRIGGKYIKMIE